MHGGIAITWEHDIQLYFKRAHGSAQLLGPPYAAPRVGSRAKMLNANVASTA